MIDMSEKLTWAQATRSILASFVGIQSKKNLDRDDSDSNIGKFIVLGFSLAILLHVLIFIIVKIIVWQSGVQ